MPGLTGSDLSCLKTLHDKVIDVWNKEIANWASRGYEIYLIDRYNGKHIGK